MKLATTIDSDSVSDLLDLTIALLNGAANDRRDSGPRTQALLAAGAVDLTRIDALVDTLFAADPSGYGRDCAPFQVKLSPPAAQAVALDFRLLEKEVAKLRVAAQTATAHDPARRWVHVIATMDRYRDPSDLTVDNPVRFTALSIQDSSYQVDSFFEDLPRLADFENLEVLVAFGNDMGSFVDCSRLKRLRSVDLGENHFSVIPAELYACTALEYLDLSSNPIRGFAPGIEALVNLRYLGLSGTELDEERLQALRRALPNCHVDTGRRVYSDFEKSLNFVLNAPAWTIRADNVVEAVPPEGLPRGEGLHLIAGRVDLSQGQDLLAAFRVDAATGETREIWWRSPAGEWIDVTEQAKNPRPAYAVQS